MANLLLTLLDADRRKALAVTADRSCRPFHLLERNVSVLWIVATSSRSDLGEHRVFERWRQ